MPILERLTIAPGYELRTREVNDCYGHPYLVREVVRLETGGVIAEVETNIPIGEITEAALRMIRMFERNQLGRGPRP